MKKLSFLGLLAGTTLSCAFPVSLQLSQDKLSVSLDTASARVGRPLTPVSVAGVARRADRRAYRRGAVAAGAAIGAGAYYGAGSYYGVSAYPGVASSAYYASGSYSSGYDAYASADFGDSDTYMLRGIPISEAEAVRYCARTFRSFDAGSRTFLAFNGERVPCPQ
jgi:BA14K-like protein